LDTPLRVILNPSAGSGAAGRLTGRLRASLDARGTPYRLDTTEGKGHGLELARDAAAAQVRAVLAVGGDGTVHEVANGLLGTEPHPPLAVLPVGTGNDFHKMLGTGRGIDAALDLLDHGTPQRFEVGRVRWAGKERFFVNVLGVGIDTEVLRQRDAFRRFRGIVQYLAALGAALKRYRPIRLEVEVDGGERIATPTMLTSVSVGPSAGGGFLLSPDASPVDGLLDLLVVRELTLLQVMRYLPRVVRGTHGNLPVVRMRRFRSATLQTTNGAPFSFELDGELVEAEASELHVEIVPDRLHVLKRARSAG
jgi:YegS/Rv2252/BmrU family lipid kinase